MARGRMINRDVSLSLKFGALVNDTTRLLATWTIPHLDKRGVFHADPQIVRSFVFPLRQDLNTQEVAAMIDDLERVGLIRRFADGGRMWQVWPGFADNQKGLHAEREGTDFPPPPDFAGKSPATAGVLPAKVQQLPDSSGKHGPEVEVEEEVQVEREVEVEGADAPTAAIPFSEPDPITKAARRAGIGSQPSPRSATAKKRAAEKFNLGELEHAPAIRVHRDVCGYVPMTPDQARQIVSGVNGCAETTWRDNLTFWMAEGYRADSIEKQLDRHEKEAKRIIARAIRPATSSAPRGRSVTLPQVSNPSTSEFAAAEERARQQRAERAARKAAMQEVSR